MSIRSFLIGSISQNISTANNVLESEEHVNELVIKHGFIKIHPFNDYDIIYGQGTLMLEMLEKYPNLDKDLQYSFYLNTLRKKKRFSPWLRKDKVTDLEIVKQYYGYSNEKASQALRILTPDQINFIKQRLDTGGMK